MRKMVLLTVVTASLWGQTARMKDRAASAADRNEACWKLTGSEAMPHFEEALADPVVRSCAAIQLRRMAASGPLLRAAQQGSPEVRASAIYELGVIKSPEAVDTLVAAAKDSDPLVSGSALHALQQYDDPRVLPALLEIAARQGVSSLAAANSLARFHDPSVLPVLYKLLESPDALLRVAAIGALGDIGDGESVAKLEPLLQQQAELRPSSGMGIGFFPSINMARAARVAIDRIHAREESHAAR